MAYKTQNKKGAKNIHCVNVMLVGVIITLSPIPIVYSENMVWQKTFLCLKEAFAECQLSNPWFNGFSSLRTVQCFAQISLSKYWAKYDSCPNPFKILIHLRF